ncbi:MAG: hypothetical protein O3C21_20805 [Verrucomicrobia bacterium]|nr:hypothetical protein [Verrucomicrobiota bacterium]
MRAQAISRGLAMPSTLRGTLLFRLHPGRPASPDADPQPGSRLGRGWLAVLSPLVLAVVVMVAIVPMAPGVAQDPSDRSAGEPTQAPLFFGKDTATWLPDAKSLPTAADVEGTAQKLSSRARNVDPFGVPTFPTEEEDPGVEDSSRPTPKVTLNQALGTLKINGVNLVTKAFLIGGRNIFEGDVIELAFRDELFKALVVTVGATEIMFRDLTRDEAGVIPHSMVRQLQLEPLQPADATLKSRMSPMEPFSPVKK